MNPTKSPILDALNADSYNWLSTTAPDLLNAVEAEVQNGKTPEAIARLVASHVGPEREALAIRCRQAAAHVQRMQERVK